VTVKSELTSLNGADARTYYERPRAAATEALRRTLSHLRATTGDASVDTKMRTLHLTRYEDVSGTDMKAPVWEWTSLHFGYSGEELTAGSWSRITRAVTTAERVPIGREWLLDAHAFLDARNYNMALSAAAVACEVYAYDVLRRYLIRGGRVSKEQASGFLDQVTKGQLLPTLLSYFEIADASMIAKIVGVFTDRNAIMHGKRRALVSASKAEAAVIAAEFLERCLDGHRA
jgi:hypothetical protein